MIITILLLTIIGSSAFFSGMKYQQSKQKTAFAQVRGFAGVRDGSQTGRSGFRPVNGEIIGTDSNSITVKLTDGSSKIVVLSDKTVINQATAATKDDLKVGTKVAVFGQENSDGSVTAQNIELNSISRAGQ